MVQRQKDERTEIFNLTASYAGIQEVESRAKSQRDS